MNETTDKALAAVLVASDRVDEYDAENIRKIILDQFERLGIGKNEFAGKKVVIKPNLIAALAPEKAATTHPTLIEAAAKIAVSYGADVLIAESSGGPYTEAAIRRITKITGIADAAERAGVPVNLDTSFQGVNYPDGKASKYFDVIKPILDADVILNICKLKTHTLTAMSCATKNLFGCIPGVQKFEQHARFENQLVFQSALVDLCEMLRSRKNVIHICDGIVAMEGNGPTGGNPKKVGYLLSSRDPYALDAAAAELIGLKADEVPMLVEEKKRGLLNGYELNGAAIDPRRDYVYSDGKLGKKFDLLPPFLKPRPQIIPEKCTGCGTCERSCPAHTIRIAADARKDGQKKIAVIDKSKCIRCFCCQELCPSQAVKIKKNLIFQIIH